MLTRQTYAKLVDIHVHVFLKALILFVTLLWIVGSLSLITPSQAMITSNESDEHRLLTSLFTGYVRTIRPTRRRGDPTYVFLRLLLYQLINVDVIGQSLDALYWFEMSWKDELLQWDAAEYGNISWIIVDKNHIWKPDMTAYEQTNLHDIEDLRHLISDPKVEFTGQVTAMEPKLLQTSCIMNVYYFPFDTQSCQVTYGSWAFGSTQIFTKLGKDPANLDNYQANPNWELLRYEAEEVIHEFADINTSFSFAIFRIIIRRQPRSVICTVILPIVLVSALSIINFMIPCETGEKMGFGITLFLALCFNLTVIAGMMPQIGIYVPLISQYCIVAIILVAMSLVGTMIVLKVHHNPLSIHPPQWAVELIVIWFGRHLHVKSALEWSKSHPHCVERGKQKTKTFHRGTCTCNELSTEADIRLCSEIPVSGDSKCKIQSCPGAELKSVVSKEPVQKQRQLYTLGSDSNSKHSLSGIWSRKGRKEDGEEKEEGGHVYANTRCDLTSNQQNVPEVSPPSFLFTDANSYGAHPLEHDRLCMSVQAHEPEPLLRNNPMNDHLERKPLTPHRMSPNLECFGLVSSRRPSFYSSRMSRKDAVFQSRECHEISYLADACSRTAYHTGSEGHRLPDFSEHNRPLNSYDPFLVETMELGKFEPVWAVMADVLDRILCILFGSIFFMIIIIFAYLFSFNP